MILLSISPFIFIQCGSGGPVSGRRREQGMAGPAGAGGRGSFWLGRRFHTGKAHRGSAVRPFRSI